MSSGLMGDADPAGKGGSQMRGVFGPGWRMNLVEWDGMLFVMLGGDDKSTQCDDVAQAIAINLTLTE